MAAREDKWIMVRIRRDVKESLDEFRAKLVRSYASGKSNALPVPDDWLSLSDCLKELLRREKAHEERSKRASAKRVQKRLSKYAKDMGVFGDN